MDSSISVASSFTLGGLSTGSGAASLGGFKENEAGAGAQTMQLVLPWKENLIQQDIHEGVADDMDCEVEGEDEGVPVDTMTPAPLDEYDLFVPEEGGAHDAVASEISDAGKNDKAYANETSMTDEANAFDTCMGDKKDAGESSEPTAMGTHQAGDEMDSEMKTIVTYAPSTRKRREYPRRTVSPLRVIGPSKGRRGGCVRSAFKQKASQRTQVEGYKLQPGECVRVNWGRRCLRCRGGRSCEEILYVWEDAADRQAELLKNRDEHEEVSDWIFVLSY
jgi:hypothetical protein